MVRVPVFDGHQGGHLDGHLPMNEGPLRGYPTTEGSPTSTLSRGTLFPTHGASWTRPESNLYFPGLLHLPSLSDPFRSIRCTRFRGQGTQTFVEVDCEHGTLVPVKVRLFDLGPTPLTLPPVFVLCRLSPPKPLTETRGFGEEVYDKETRTGYGLESESVGGSRTS